MSIIIGVDTGVTTGIAVWNCAKGNLLDVRSMKIHAAMEYVLSINPDFVRVEDARKRKWFGNAGRSQLQGAGSIKRDAVIWEDFLTDKGIVFELVAPKNNSTKLSRIEFARKTGWTNLTNEHSRDAAMLVVGFTERNLRNSINILKK